MEVGNIVEYIDRQRILCAVVVEVRSQRLRLLTENNKEVSLASDRLLHRDRSRLDLNVGRLRTVDLLKEVAAKRKALIDQVCIRELWEVLNTEQEWIDLKTMTGFCFPDHPNGDHESAVIRAFFDDRLYFKFNPDRFFPNSEEQVAQLEAQRREGARRQRVVEWGGNWLRRFLAQNGQTAQDEEDGRRGEFLDVLKSYFLFGKESPDHSLALGMLELAGLDGQEDLFPVLVALGVLAEDENVELLRFGAPVAFPPEVHRHAAAAVQAHPGRGRDPHRQDLTDLRLVTIDGQSTLDYDDALSLERIPEGFRLGVHIVDVAEVVRKEDPIDVEARRRGSSIYMADRKIPMLPPELAEGLCSLKAGEVRPAISTLVDLSPGLNVIGYRIIPSTVCVKQQLTYFDVNLSAEQNEDVVVLRRVAQKFRDARLGAGAVHISVPEINVWISENGDVNLSKVNRESPGRMLVSELMILANWLTARFLAANAMPGVFRSQPEPRERLYRGEEGTLFQHWMQRRLLNRFVLGHAPAKHAGLGLDAYVTATSPIRKYFDLATQRQVRAILGLEEPYPAEEIDRLLQALELPMSHVSKLQAGRQRYWLLKLLAQRVGQKEEAIVLVRRRKSYQVLLTEYMLECDLPVPGFLELRPDDLIQVTIQKVDARKDLVALALS
jgi:exoribonuclease-2